MTFNRLSLSLLFAVVFGVFGLGYAISELYGVLSKEESSAESQIYQELGKRIARHLAVSQDIYGQAERASELTGLDLQILDYGELPLQAQLRDQLDSGQALLLQSEGVDQTRSISLLNRIPNSDLLLSIDELPMTKSEQPSGLSIALTFVFYGGLFGVVLVWLTPLVRRLSALRQVTQAFGQGQLERRVDNQKPSYIAPIESDFNRMADQIEQLMADNRLLSRAVSHDLKTPLARLRFGLEVLNDSQDTETRESYRSRIESDIDEMESLVTTLLDYARMEDNRPELCLEKIDLCTWVPEQIIQANEAVKICWQQPDELPSWVCADPRYLRMILHNICSNAGKFSKYAIHVSVKRQGSNWELCVEDDGDGILEHERERVLQPFYRVQQERTHQGHGMGLAIVKRLAQWQQIGLSIGASDALGGAAICLSFKDAERPL